MLHLYNRIWSGEGVPTRWRRQLIKPLLKEGKDPKQTISYRPISLISCLGKILERMIADRLIYILETKNLLNDKLAFDRDDAQRIRYSSSSRRRQMESMTVKVEPVQW